jgi:hypothetical protein
MTSHPSCSSTAYASICLLAYEPTLSCTAWGCPVPRVNRRSHAMRLSTALRQVHRDRGAAGVDCVAFQPEVIVEELLAAVALTLQLRLVGQQVKRPPLASSIDRSRPGIGMKRFPERDTS